MCGFPWCTVKQKITNIYLNFSMYFLYNCVYSLIFDRECTRVSFELASPRRPVLFLLMAHVRIASGEVEGYTYTHLNAVLLRLRAPIK
jgi:hypothetical protein